MWVHTRPVIKLVNLPIKSVWFGEELVCNRTLMKTDRKVNSGPTKNPGFVLVEWVNAKWAGGHSKIRKRTIAWGILGN